MITNDKITAEKKELYFLYKVQLRAIMSRRHHVPTSLTKGDLVAMSLVDTFGRKAMTAYNA